MVNRYPPINPRCPHILHGGDYNPDQWLDRPDVIEEDLRLAKLAGVNTWSVGIFGWAALEPEEGRFEFGWLDDIMDRMASSGMKAVLNGDSSEGMDGLTTMVRELASSLSVE